MNPQDLLQKTNRIMELAFQKHKEQGDDFNIFYILNRERDEAHSHCLFLYELLNPNGKHYHGDAFLKFFFEIVLKKEYPDEKPVVLREFAFDKESRLDFLIRGKDFCYPVEVKIDASEGDRQIERYCAWAKSVSENSTVFFLTLDGRESVTVSKENRKMVNLISFKEDISKWLAACIDYANENVGVRECIRQYYNVVERLTNNMYKNETLELQNLVSASSENIKSAMLIHEAFEKSKEEMDKKVFSTIEKHVDSLVGNKFEKIDKSYIEKAGKSFPALAYILHKSDNGTSAIALRFEIDSNLFFGTAFYLKDKEGKWFQTTRANSNFGDEVLKEFRFFKEKGTSYFEAWEHLPSKDRKIGFRSCSDAWIALFDPDRFEQTMQEIYLKIDSQFEKIGLI